MGEGRPIRVVVVSHSLVPREGTAALLRPPAFEVVDVAGTAEGMVEAAGVHRPDVVLVIGRLGPTRVDEHVRAAMEIRSRWPEVGVLVLGRTVELDLVADMLASRADRLGYLLKDNVTTLEHLTEALELVGRGGSTYDPELVSRLMGRGRGEPDRLARLTPREREVLALLAEGCSNVAIAKRLVVSARAVEKHVTNVFDKLDLPATEDHHRRVLAVLAHLGHRL